jgi:hypothetical protein
VYTQKLHNYKFVQAHRLELLLRVHTKFILKFLDLPTSFSRFSNFGIHLLELFNEKKNGQGLNGAWVESGPWPRPFGVAACGAGAHRPTGTAQPTGETGPRGARPLVRRAQCRGHHAVATHAVVGWCGWPGCTGGQGVSGKVV